MVGTVISDRPIRLQDRVGVFLAKALRVGLKGLYWCWSEVAGEGELSPLRCRSSSIGRSMVTWAYLGRGPLRRSDKPCHSARNLCLVAVLDDFFVSREKSPLTCLLLKSSRKSNFVLLYCLPDDSRQLIANRSPAIFLEKGVHAFTEVNSWQLLR